MVRRSIFGFVLLLLVTGFAGVSPASAVVDTATIVPSPNAGTTEDVLTSVSCVSVSSCTALGYTYTGSAWATLAIALTGPPPPTTTTSVSSDPVLPAFAG